MGRDLALPPAAVYVGRGTRTLPPSVWRNPFRISRCGSRRAAVEAYRTYLAAAPALQRRLPELAGMTLLCHCAPHEACHADVLIEAFRAQAARGGAAAAAPPPAGPPPPCQVPWPPTSRSS